MGTGHIVTDLIASYDAYTERRKADSTFLSDTLIDVAAWFAADEAADAQELADSLSDNYARFDAMFNYLSDSIQATLDSAALAFANDEFLGACGGPFQVQDHAGNDFSCHRLTKLIYPLVPAVCAHIAMVVIFGLFGHSSAP